VGDNKNDDEYDMHVWQPGWAMKQSKINGPELHCTKKKAQEIPKDIYILRNCSIINFIHKTNT